MVRLSSFVPLITDHNPVLYVVQYLKTVVFYILSSFLFVNDRRAILDHHTLPYLEAEVSLMTVCTLL